ncbi:MAG: trypsin-like peptidase domain-containing protein [Candidatus Saccharimonadales bacterium]
MDISSTTPSQVNDQPAQTPHQTSRSATFRTRRNRVILVVSVVVLALVSGFVGSALYSSLQKPLTQLTRGSGQDGNLIVSGGEEDIAAVAAKVSPSVVSIVTTVQSRSFETGEGAGTGIIISANGYIITNKHVVSDASNVSVVTSDGTTYDNVELVGVDPLNDVAFLKVKGVTDLKPAEIGDSSSIRIGQKVVAIGNALGQYQNTVTSGIISGTGRPVSAQAGETVETLTDLLQTDASINPGNSGGPLVNVAGQVIGINTAIASDAAGIGFAIPINATKGLMTGVLETGKISRAYLGVSYQTITPEVAKQYKLSVSQGAYVVASNQANNAVVKNGPADKAGIQNKDIITKINDKSVGDKGGVASLIGEYKPGDTIQLTILRDNKTFDVRVTLAAYSS